MVYESVPGVSAAELPDDLFANFGFFGQLKRFHAIIEAGGWGRTGQIRLGYRLLQK